MESIDKFIKYCENKINLAYSGKIILFNFLDEFEIALVKKYCPKDLYLYESGRIIDSTRKRILISNFEMDNINFKIDLFKINYNKKFYSLNHRNVLGSLMSLGIKRECIGDIIIDDNNDIYFSATNEIKDYLINEFHYVSNSIVELEEIDYDVKNIIKYDIKNYIIPSFRLDVIIANAFNLSRSEALEYVTSGLVFVNQILNLNPSHIVKVEDIISVRHKGKIKLMNIKNKTRTDKFLVEIGRRI